MTSLESKENILSNANAEESGSRTPAMKRTMRDRDRERGGGGGDRDRGGAGDRVSDVKMERDALPFYHDLQNFHEARNTPMTRLPKINGREVDLQKLYKEVINRGGWLKVNIRNEWEDLIKALGYKDKCVNACVALKHIYTRYLDKYERLHFLGEDPDKLDEQDDDGRPSKKYVSKNCNSISMVYNEKQHNIPDHMRIQHKMSTDLYSQSEYDKLVLSLLSPLPNEQDFAINVCTLMANEANHTLKINRCPKLLDALVAHAGVYCHFSIRDLFHELYAKTRKHSLQTFWNDCLQDRSELLDLSYDDYFQSPGDKYMDTNSNIARPPLRLGQQATPSDGLASTSDDLKSNDFRNYDFLSLGRSLGTQDYVGQRIQQIASIIRNLSFFEENVSTLVSNRTFIRFLVMCSNIRWGNIHHMALDVCGNIAPQLELADPIYDDLTRCLMLTICEGIESQDRGVIISCLEILYKLCQTNSNKKFLHSCLDQNIYNQMCLYLSLNDIMLLLYTLECIYALSSLGPRECSSLIQVRGIIGSLVSLITVEGQSYGADGCIQMRVVETVPGNMLPLVAQNIANIANLQNAAMHIQNQQQTEAKLSEINSKQIQQQEADQFAAAWLGATLEPAQSTESRVDTQELYQMYTTASEKHNRRGIVSNTQFSRLVRNAFGISIGPNWLKPENSTGPEGNKLYYVSIRIRANPLPIQVKPQMPLTHSPIKSKETPLKKQKKKPKPKDQETPIKQEIINKSTVPLPIAAIATTKDEVPTTVEQIKPIVPSIPVPIVGPAPAVMTNIVKPIALPENITLPQTSNVVIKKTVIAAPQPQPQPQQQIIGNVIISHTPAPSAIVSQQQQTTILKPTTTTNEIIQQKMQVTTTTNPTLSNANANGQSTPSSLIKSLLANKNASAAPNNPSCLITQNVNLHQVAQRQQKQKEMQLQQHQPTQISTPIKLTTTTINALVNNTLMQSTPVKVGQTTIKPISANMINEKKIIQINHENRDNNLNWDPVPPLAPLSSGPIVRQIVVTSNNDDSNSTTMSINSNQMNLIGDGDNSAISFEGLLMPKSEQLTLMDDDSSKDSIRSNQVIISNQMLVDLLDKKCLEPPHSSGSVIAVKRRLDDDSSDIQMKKLAVASVDSTTKPTASKNAANLYAEMAASILNDEDLDEPLPPPQQLQTVITQKIPEHQKQIITVPVNLPRQLIVNHHTPSQVILSSQPSNTIVTQSAPVTIKTDQSMQSVPIIIQKQGQQQQIIQSSQNTQYVLATNPQGQTYLVAQPQSQPQTLLMTQTPQPSGPPTKTFYLVQQQGGPPQQIISAPQTPQKVIMTTPQGQQMIVTQMTRPVQQHPTIIMNPTGANNTQTIQITQQQSIPAPALSQSTIMTQFPNIPPSLKIQQTMVPAIQANTQKSLPPPGKPSVSIVAQTTATVAPTVLTETKKPCIDKAQVIITNVAESVAEPKMQVQPAKTNPTPVVNQQQQLIIKREAPSTPPITPSSVPTTTTQSTVITKPTPSATEACPVPAPIQATIPAQDDEDLNWLWICDWRNCPRKKFKSLNEVYRHACIVHCPEHLDPAVEIYCQWGCGPNLCDGVPRKRFSLMTHLFDRHCTVDSFKAAVQRRLSNGGGDKKPPAQPVTIIKTAAAIAAAQQQSECSGTASPALSTSSSSSQPSAASAAMHAIKRHASDFINPKELMNPKSENSESILSITSNSASVASNNTNSTVVTSTNELDLKQKIINDTNFNALPPSDENEGPVTKSIRLTSALILRNLVTHTTIAKKYMRQYEPHLAGVALSNVESSGTISQILYELNN